MAVCLEMLLLAPELAVLDALEAALDASVTALTAAHVDLESSDFVATASESPSAQVCMADSILNQAHGLRQSLHRYRTLISMTQVWESRVPPDEALSR